MASQSARAPMRGFAATFLSPLSRSSLARSDHLANWPKPFRRTAFSAFRIVSGWEGFAPAIIGMPFMQSEDAGAQRAQMARGALGFGLRIARRAGARAKPKRAQRVGARAGLGDAAERGAGGKAGRRRSTGRRAAGTARRRKGRTAGLPRCRESRAQEDRTARWKGSHGRNGAHRRAVRV